MSQTNTLHNENLTIKVKLLQQKRIALKPTSFWDGPAAVSCNQEKAFSADNVAILITSPCAI